MTLKDVEDQLADVLVGAGLGLVRGTNLWVGEMPAKAGDQSVLVRQTGGDPTRTFLGGSTQVTEGVQVVVRGVTNGRPAAQALARSCWAALHHATVAGYILITAEQTPTSMGSDASSRPQYVFNLRALYDAG